MEVKGVGELVARRLMTMGVSFTGCAVPGGGKKEELPGEVMIGMGIHGERGCETVGMTGCKELISRCVDDLCNFGYDLSGKFEVDTMVKLKSGDEVVVLVNNLGGTSVFEMGIVVKEAMESFWRKGIKVRKCYSGSFMTAFDMKGVSVTALYLGEERDKILEWLDAPTSSSAWPSKTPTLPGTPGPPQHTPPPPVSPPTSKLTFKEDTVWGSAFPALSTSCLQKATSQLIASESKLTEWDEIVGDGDCGTTMSRGANRIREALKDGRIDVSGPCSLFHGLANCVSMSMGGTSGALIEIFFRSLGKTLETYQQGGSRKVDKEGMGAAFVKGVNAVAEAGGAKIGYRTMLDALVPAATVVKREGDWTLGQLVEAATAGAESTKEMEAKAGRSNYLSFETIKGVPDPGAMAVKEILEGLQLACREI